LANIVIFTNWGKQGVTFLLLNKSIEVSLHILPNIYLVHEIVVFWWSISPIKKGSHFHYDIDLFVPSEKKDILTSTSCWSAIVSLLVRITTFMGPTQIIKFYVIP